MATYVENLTTIRNKLAETLATEMSYQATNGPKPSYSADGRSVSWNEWLSITTAQLEKLNQMIIAADTPFEIAVEHYT